MTLHRTPLAAALLLASASLLAPSAQAMVCYSTVHYVCDGFNLTREVVYDATGLLVDVVYEVDPTDPTHAGGGVLVVQDDLHLNLAYMACYSVWVVGATAWLSQTAECTSPPYMMVWPDTGEPLLP